jgi:hypothetical protein
MLHITVVSQCLPSALAPCRLMSVFTAAPNNTASTVELRQMTLYGMELSGVASLTSTPA